ncbi:MAG TPA: hypothetical protein DD723_08250 [Candidatus Omnitrophica bacterium]|nr:MAG: hypothetical protein A2Z81_08200 [Omnitrophica WOR_2 bacterium GWA2_45_18]HBR15513.1 hypothetical protein [Candidatus Omnitrophota bacterium]
MKLIPPNGEKRVLLHSCCAPCSGEIMEAMVASGIQLTVIFYNPNIHPVDEYQRRKEENIRFTQKMKIPFVDADYDQDRWFLHTKGLENEPERGKRCALCFYLRLAKTASFARDNGFKIFTSSFGVSRWKNIHQVNESGMRAASRYPGLIYWTYNWRKDGGSLRMVEIARREDFYRQNYCGCVYSLNRRTPAKAIKH